MTLSKLRSETNRELSRPASGKIKLAQVGCGGMGLRHIYGLTELMYFGFG